MTAIPSVHFNDAVIPVEECELDIAAALNIKRSDDTDGSTAHHLEFVIPEGEDRCHDDTFPVWMPIGSTFSIPQTMIQVSEESRITSNSISFQPRTLSSMRT